MADTTEQIQSSSALRQVLYSAYSFVRSIEANKSVGALTLDHLLQQHIQSLKQGATTDLLDGSGKPRDDLGKRISRWDQLDAIETQLEQVMQKIQQAGDDPGKLQALGLFEVDQGSEEGS